ncbi:unnamed protein product [Tenebrio molitor]|nr:unnamed protein product [Tenebrio molitor]
MSRKARNHCDIAILIPKRSASTTNTMLKHLLICVIICLLGSVISATRVTEEMKEDCRQKNGLTVKDVKELGDGDENFTSWDKKKCYIKCMFEKGGYIQSDGTILVEKMRRNEIADGDKERLDKVYGCISKLNNVSTCDKIVDLLNCFSP